MSNQKIDALPYSKESDFNGARFLKNKLVFEGHRNVGALRDLDARKFCSKRIFCTEICQRKQISCAQSVHTLKGVVLDQTL